MQPNKKVVVEQKLPISSQIRCTKFQVDPEHDSLPILLDMAAQLPQVQERIKKRFEKDLERIEQRLKAGKIKPEDYQAKIAKAAANARMLECTEALRNGEVEAATPVSHSRGENMLLRGFWEDLFDRFAGTASANQTLEIKYLALGTSYADSSFSQEDLTNETYRDTTTDTYEDGLRTYYTTMWTQRSQANPNSTTLSDDVDSESADTLPLTAVTGVIVGARLQVETATNIYKCTVLSIDSLDVTVGNIVGGNLPSTGASEFDENDLPLSGNNVFVLIAEGGCIIGDDATSSTNSGKAMNRKKLEEKKTEVDSLLWDYVLAGASVD